jgi:hypothetical protein
MTTTQSARITTARSARLLLLCAALLAIAPGGAHAHESLFALVARLDKDKNLAASIADYEAHADVQDGFLIGTAVERLRHQPDGTLVVERTRHYTHVRHPDTRAVAKLPQPWDATATFQLDRSLRLVRADTRLHFLRSGDTVFPGYKLSDHHDWLFQVDHTLLRAADGGKLEYQAWSQGKSRKSERYDYPRDSAPIEVIALYLSIAVQRHIDQFDFELLVPGGGTHGVRAQVHRTRDPARFAAGYRLPKERLVAPETLALVDLRLASPVKYVFFPHHFFMAFSEREPAKLMMMWGGDPDDSLQAFRTE